MEENLHGLPDYNPSCAPIFTPGDGEGAPSPLPSPIEGEGTDVSRDTYEPQPSKLGPQRSVLTVVGWFWQDKGKHTYTVEHVNTWARMIHRHLSLPHRFVLMTDYPPKYWDQFDPLIEPKELWADWRTIKNPSWPAGRPNCYVRLKAFNEKAREYFGDRFVSIDLDCVVVGDLDPLFDRDEDFLIFRRQVQQVPRDRLNPYQASMWMMTAGARKKVFDDFKGEASIRSARGFMGTDQAWITKCLGPDEKGWTQEDGVYGFAAIHRQLVWKKEEVPAGARIVFFYGGDKPWKFTGKNIARPRCQQCGAEFDLKRYKQEQSAATYQYPWVAKHYKISEKSAVSSEPVPETSPLTPHASPSMRDISPSETGAIAGLA